MFFNSLLVIVGNVYYDLIVFGNTIIGIFTDAPLSLQTNNIFINTYVELTGQTFPYFYHLSNFVLGNSGMLVNTNFVDYYTKLITYSSYGLVALIFEFALTIGVVFFALKFVSKVARLIKDIIIPI